MTAEDVLLLGCLLVYLLFCLIPLHFHVVLGAWGAWHSFRFLLYGREKYEGSVA